MKIEEAIKIYEIWQQWSWPFHSLLFSIFQSNIPESFLPYPKDVLNEALEEILNLYSTNSKEFEAVNYTKSSLQWSFSDGKDALDLYKRKLSDPEMVEIISVNIKKYTDDWVKWAEEKNQ